MEDGLAGRRKEPFTTLDFAFLPKPIPATGLIGVGNWVPGRKRIVGADLSSCIEHEI